MNLLDTIRTVDAFTPHLLGRGSIMTVSSMLAENPTREVLVQAVRKYRWAEHDGTYTDLLTKRSASLQHLPGR